MSKHSEQDGQCPVSYKRFDIFTFSETSLNPSIKDSELNIPGCTLVRHYQTSKRGCGTAIYVHNSIPYKHRPDLSAENIESSWVQVNRLSARSYTGNSGLFPTWVKLGK